ncbi:hypothetical protein MTR67_007722, partial [Solanum verrucosum]
KRKKILMLWHKLKKALSLKRKVNNSQNETHLPNHLLLLHRRSPCPVYPAPLHDHPRKTFSMKNIFLPTKHTLSFNASMRETCVICLGSMKAEKGKAIFTAECMHSFHFSCIGENVKHGNLLCPICRCKWKEIPFQFATDVTIVRRIRVLHHVNRFVEKLYYIYT